MTQEQFSTFTNEDIPQQLYHVMDSDVDEETGATCLQVPQTLKTSKKELKRQPERR